MSAQSDRRELAAGRAAVHRRVRELLDDGLYLNRPDFMFSGCIRDATRFPVDNAALPEELAEKVAAREKVFGETPAPYMPGYREDPSRRTPRLVFVLVAVMALLPFLLGYGLMKVDIPAPAAWSLEFTPWVLVALTPLAIRLWKNRGPLALTRAEARLVRLHTTTIDPSWVPYTLEREGDALQAAALEVIVAIDDSPAWKSEHCDLHRIQLNLTEEAYQVTESCANLSKLSDMIAEVKPTGTSSSGTRRQLESTVSEYETCYKLAKDAVVNRIAALYAYKNRLDGIETLLSDIEKTTILERRSDNFTATFEAIVKDEYAAAHTRKLAEELADLQVRLQAELAFISGEIIDAPALVAPLTRADATIDQPGQANPK